MTISQIASLLSIIALAVFLVWWWDDGRCHYQSGSESLKIALDVDRFHKKTGSFKVRDVFGGDLLFYCVAGRKSGFDEAGPLFKKFALNDSLFPEDCGFWFGSTRLVVFQRNRTLDVAIGNRFVADVEAICSVDLDKEFGGNAAGDF
ncbi:MAG: hypothetical protein ABL907_08910 [Hyphomicrobium sp.]